MGVCLAKSLELFCDWFLKARVNADLASTFTLHNGFPLTSPSHMLKTYRYCKYLVLFLQHDDCLPP